MFSKGNTLVGSECIHDLRAIEAVVDVDVGDIPMAALWTHAMPGVTGGADVSENQLRDWWACESGAELNDCLPSGEELRFMYKAHP